MNAPRDLAEGIRLYGCNNLAEANEFLKSPESLKAGVAILLMGELAPGKVDAKIVSGEPIRSQIVAAANTSLQRMAVVSMSTYYDHRHASFLAKSVMIAIAEARGLSEADGSSMPKDTIPFGDIGRMAHAGIDLVVNLDDVLGFPVIRQDAPLVASPAI